MTASWAGFGLAFLIFALAHAVPARPTVRSRLTAWLGERRFLRLYSAVSLGLLYWLLLAAGDAPYVQLWPPEPWQAWLVNLVMPVVVLLAAVSVGRPNPFSFGGGGGSGEYDPKRPGITALSRHPLLLAIVLWALAHTAANGDLAHVLLFGLFALMAVLGMPMLDRRRRLAWGADVFAERARNTSLWPGAAWLTGRAKLDASALPVQRLMVALVVYGVLLWLHPLLLGVSPVPPR